MYKIIFYTDKRGESEVGEYIANLQKKSDKDSKIKVNKIISYIDMLSEKGIKLGQKYVKHLRNDIWELRPLRDRILFAYISNNIYILLNVFIKKTQKTPEREIKKAEQLLKDFISRGDLDG